jgi:hypothetical protein
MELSSDIKPVMGCVGFEFANLLEESNAHKSGLSGDSAIGCLNILTLCTYLRRSMKMEVSPKS